MSSDHDRTDVTSDVLGAGAAATKAKPGITITGGFAASGDLWRDQVNAALDGTTATFTPTVTVSQNTQWETAKQNIQKYIDANLDQVQDIYRVAQRAMYVGFAFILFGVGLAFYRPSITPALVASVSGIISQFISLTFMALYRSTMAQATGYFSDMMTVNTVGMAVEILNAIPETKHELKDKTRAEMVALLIGSDTRTVKRKKRTD